MLGYTCGMTDSDREPFSKSKLVSMREKWSEPDQTKGQTWEFDGVAHDPEHWMGYSHEMREGLGMFGCKTFDKLTSYLREKLNRKPNVVDLMGGAYFLDFPENVGSLVGIRIHDKDTDFLEVSKKSKSERAWLLEKIIQSPNRRVIEADILTNAGWRVIKGENLPLADLVVCRPGGPFDVEHATVSRFDNPAIYAGLYTSLFRRMLKLVNKESGVVFTEIPDIFSDTEIDNFFVGIDKSEKSRTKVFTVPDVDYHWGGKKRKYAVVQFGN